MEYKHTEEPEGKPAFRLVEKTDAAKTGEPGVLNYYDNSHVERTARVVVQFPPEESSGQPDEDQPKSSMACEPDQNVPVSGNDPPDVMNETGQLKNNQLLFHGLVRDDDNNTMENAVVMVIACYKGGGERILGHCYTDSEGAYVINILEPQDIKKIEEFKIMAGMSVQKETAPYPHVYEKEETGQRGTNRGFHSVLRRLYSSPGKTLPQLFDDL